MLSDLDIGDGGDATNAQVAEYATAAFTYNAADKVSSATIQGAGCTCTGHVGLGTYTYSYSSSDLTPSIHTWNEKTIETLPNGSTNTVYTNDKGEVMLNVFEPESSDDKWMTYYKYDDSGNLIFTAFPSAVTGYSEDYDDLVGFSSGTSYADISSDSGKIQTTEFPTTTTATISDAGNVLDYAEATFVQQGTGGTAIEQSSFDYIEQSATGGNTIVLPNSQTLYANTDGSGGRTTNYVYTFQTNDDNVTNQIYSVETEAPQVTAAEDGPGSGRDTTTQVFDSFGRLQWTEDGGGYLTYTAYDPATGGVTASIQGVDTSDSDEYSDLPETFPVTEVDGPNLVTTYTVDSLGRPLTTTDPNGNVTYAIYHDVDHAVLTYPGWTGTTTTGPVTETRTDEALGYTETMTFAPDFSDDEGAPSGDESIAGIQSLSRQYMDNSNQVTASYAYFDVTDLDYSTGVIGSVNTNYYETDYYYDEAGNRDKVVSPLGTITRTVYDALNRPISTYVGTDDTTSGDYWTPATNDTGSSNLVDTTDYVYDNGGVGDGNLTETISHPTPGTAADDRITVNAYDWRDRLVLTKSGIPGTETDPYETGDDSGSPGAEETDGVHRPIYYYELDNLGEATATDQYDGDEVAITSTDGVPDQPDISLLVAKTATSYDSQGRPYLTKQYSVTEGMTAAPTASLDTYSFYDRRGNQIETRSPGGLVTKTVYDGAGRATDTYTTDGAGISASDLGTSAAWNDASTVEYDHVVTQTETTFDADGNAVITITRQRDHDDPVITDDEPSGLGAFGTPTSGNEARVSYMQNFYDVADRLIASVNIGTNGGENPATSDMTNHSWWGGTSVPSRSDTVLVTSYAYDDAGRLHSTTDPRDIQSLTYYDALGRTTETDAGHTSGDGVPSSIDQITEYTYDHDSNMVTMTADPDGDNETTTYTYGVTTGGSSSIDSYDLLDSVTYPAGAGTTQGDDDANNNIVYYAYDALGETTQMTDENGTVHAYSYDSLGRMTLDDVTNFGTGVDSTIVALGYSFDGAGRPFQYTSYDEYTDADDNDIANQVQEAYNGFGQVTGEYQEHNGAVDTGSSAEVQYGYDTSRLVYDGTTASGSNDTTIIDSTLPAASDGYYDGYVATITSGTDAGDTETVSASNFNSMTDTWTITLGSALDSAPGSDASYTLVPAEASESRLVSMTYPGGRQIDYSYGTTSGENGTVLDNAISRVTSIIDDATSVHLVDYQYMGLSTIVDAKNPEPSTDMTYIGDGTGVGGDQYTGLDQFGRVDEQLYTYNNTTDLVDLQYGYDADSNVLYENNTLESSQSELFHASSSTSDDDATAYDALNRLTGYEQGTLSSSGNNGSVLDTVSSPSVSESWSLDALGNWDSQTVGETTTDRTINARNQVTQIGTGDDATHLTYDSNGNVLDDGTNTYTYDAWNRMATFTTGGKTYTDSYDGLGRRIVEDYVSPLSLVTIVPSYTGLYYSTNWQVVEEDNQTHISGHVNTTTNVWGQQYVNDLVEKDVTPNGDSTTRYYAEHDANFDTMALVSTAGAVLERYDYDPYGTPTFENSDFSAKDGSDYGMQVLFQGGRYDPTSGLTNFEHRDLNSALGTWDQEDPVGSFGSPNLYEVLDSDPTAMLDAAGSCAACICITHPGACSISVTHGPGAPPAGIAFNAGTNWVEAFGYNYIAQINPQNAQTAGCTLSQEVWNQWTFQNSTDANNLCKLPHCGLVYNGTNPNHWNGFTTTVNPSTNLVTAYVPNDYAPPAETGPTINDTPQWGSAQAGTPFANVGKVNSFLFTAEIFINGTKPRVQTQVQLAITWDWGTGHFNWTATGGGLKDGNSG